MHSSIEKLTKFFRLERELKFSNRAIVGGLDKIIPNWEQEARQNRLEPHLIDKTIEVLQSYPGMPVEEREAALDGLIDYLVANERSKPPQTANSEAPAAKEAMPVNKESAHEGILPEAPLDRLPSKVETRPNEFIDEPRPPRPVVRSTNNRSQVALSAPLTAVSGIGEKHAQTLERLGLYTINDLLYYFPRRYDDYSRLKPINRLEYGEQVTVLGTIQAIQSRPVRGGAAQLVEAVLSDGTGTLRLSWFNRSYLMTKFRPGMQVVLAGKIDLYLGRLVMSNPDIEELEKEQINTNRIVPVYGLTNGITQRWLRNIIHGVVTFWAPRVDDYLPASVRSAMKVVDLGVALLQTHFPDSQDSLDLARWRLAFDEIFLMQMGVMQQKRTWETASGRVFETPDEWLSEQTNLLPYQLTNAQSRALQEIRQDLSSGRPMDRLLQGDVGSGKTVVAALGASMVTRHGAQAAVMAPTSILAEQHYRSFTRLLATPAADAPALLEPEQIRLMVGDTKENEKAEIRAGLEDGSIRLVIGTHTLIEDPIAFKDLQFVAIDEQHRFGVKQRAQLRSKGTNPHLLVMTATPIPRSLALTVYGDLDLTVMDEMPAGRQPIETHVLHPLERERAYQLIQSQVAMGRQAFIIYPMVEQGDKDEALAAVENHANLQSKIFPKLKLGLLHGRMRPEEKDQVMASFRDGEFNILVSTSVVEVGVDVPNATVMLIEGANRFGLSQLHQFRGRVGRGQNQSFCLLIPDKEDALENERLAVMAETNDGFILAERDLQQRGPGEFLGTRQAGYSELKMANLMDVKLIEKARQQAQTIFQVDPELSAEEHAALKARVQQFWSNGKGDIS